MYIVDTSNDHTKQFCGYNADCGFERQGTIQIRFGNSLWKFLKTLILIGRKSCVDMSLVYPTTLSTDQPNIRLIN